MKRIIGIAVAVLASQLAHAEEQYDAIRKRIARDRVRVRFLQKEESSILRGLQDLERAIDRKRRTVVELGRLVERIGVRIAELDRNILANDDELEQLRLAAGRRAAAMHRLRRTSIASILSRVSDPVKVRRARDRLRFVLTYDAGLIRSAREASAEDRRLKRELSDQRLSMSESQAALEEETEESLMLKEERAALLEAIRGERRTYQRLARELRAAARRLEKEIGVVRGVEPGPDAVAGGFAAQRGRLPWPVPGRVEVAFGRKVDPESGMVMVSKGIDVRAAQSEPVRSVFSGTVAHASRFEGFGRVAIIDHGGGWYSVYAHLESFLVRAGQKVNQYQVLGLVGDSGSTKGAYLYFEIRKGRQPVDPMTWLVGTDRQRASPPR